MDLSQINSCILDEWKKQGELLIIWGCRRCHKKIPFYKQCPFIDNIIMVWVSDHNYCNKCDMKMRGITATKKKIKIPRIQHLLEKYEVIEEYLF